MNNLPGVKYEPAHATDSVQGKNSQLRKTILGNAVDNHEQEKSKQQDKTEFQFYRVKRARFYWKAAIASRFITRYTMRPFRLILEFFFCHVINQ